MELIDLINANPLRTVRHAIVLACVALLTLGALPAGAHASPKTGDGHFAPYPADEVAPLAESGNITAGSCTYRQAIDDPHVTSGDTSVHGWWLKISGTCPDKANVDVYLQAYWCDSWGCGWVTLASGSDDYYAGGGSGKRANARVTCSNSSTVGWRGFVDVDLNGVADPPGYTYSTIKNLSCSP